MLCTRRFALLVCLTFTSLGSSCSGGKFAPQYLLPSLKGRCQENCRVYSGSQENRNDCASKYY